MSHDPYCYPNSNVLRNRLDIRNQEELAAVEARSALIALFDFCDEPIQGPINEDRLKATHRAIFGTIYDWAGTYRKDTGTMTKGRAAGYKVTYGSSQFVPAEMERIFNELKSEDYLRGLDHQHFAERLAYFYSEIDSTHPFREGNSRTLRQFSADLAFTAGYELDWELTGKTKESRTALYKARDAAFMNREYEPLLKIIRANLQPLQP